MEKKTKGMHAPEFLLCLLNCPHNHPDSHPGSQPGVDRGPVPDATTKLHRAIRGGQHGAQVGVVRQQPLQPARRGRGMSGGSFLPARWQRGQLLLPAGCWPPAGPG